MAEEEKSSEVQGEGATEEEKADEKGGEGDGGEEPAKEKASKSTTGAIAENIAQAADAAVTGAEQNLSTIQEEEDAPKEVEGAVEGTVETAVEAKDSPTKSERRLSKTEKEPDKKKKSTVVQDGSKHVVTEEDEEKLEEYIFAMSGINLHEEEDIIEEEEDEYRSSRLSDFVYEYEREIPEFQEQGKTATIRVADMPDEMQQDAVNCAAYALDKYEHEVDAAAFIKLEFDKKYETSWHCVVGREFGSYITHEIKHFVYFYLDEIGVLLFRNG